MPPEIEPMTASKAIIAIPAEARPAVIDWLEALAVNADATALRIDAENKDKKHPGVAGLSQYWKNVASGHRLAASRMRMSGPVPKRSKGKKKDERS